MRLISYVLRRTEISTMMPSFTKLLVTALSLYFACAQDYRLPTIYNPSNYKISLDLPEAVFSETSNEYTGVVTISLTVTSNTSEIVLHSSLSHLNVTNVVVTDTVVSSFSVNASTDILTIILESELNITVVYDVTITFIGRLSTTDMYGFYKSSYSLSDSNETQYLATTQFESTYARRAFPCFDEPGYKATFSISLRHPSGLKVLGNTQIVNSTDESNNNYTITEFAITPIMPTYLVAFIISNFTCSPGEPLEGNSTLINQVCSRSETDSIRDWALEVTPLIINSLNEYTGINYSLSSLTKLDQVAIPDFSAGAMENWGLITYRERALLYDANETSNSYKQYIAAVIAHELGHQWFGNLVTCQWWSEIFLNEGFATLMEFFITHEILPDYQMDKQFVIKTLQYIFEEDSSSTDSLRTNASTPSEISAKFGSITYDKGGSILRMVEHVMGSTAFKSGLNAYLTLNLYGSVEPVDLWTALNTTVNAATSQLPADLSVVMENWIEQPGYPVLNVSIDGTNLTISQERFVFNSSMEGSSWYVPITYTTSNDVTGFDSTAPVAWLAPLSNLTLTYPSGASWIIINNQQTGYYRVNYDSILWTNLTTALFQTEFSGIPEINRAQIVDDAFNLARGGYLAYPESFRITEFLLNDTSYISWYPAFSGFDYLIRRVGQNSTLGHAISTHILELSYLLRNSVPISTTNDSNHIYTLNQVQTNSWACRLGNSNCTERAVELFQAYKNTSERPDKNLRSIIYCYGLKHSNDASSDWEFLWNAFSTNSLATEQNTLLAALGCASNQTILSSYLQKTLLDDSGIRSQDYASVFSSVYRGSAAGVDIALDFFIDNYESISDRYTSMNSVGNILKGIAEQLTTDAQISKLETFISSGAPNGTMLEYANLALASAQNNLEWLNTYKSVLYSYYNLEEETTAAPIDNSTSSTTTSSTTSSVTTTVAPATTPLGGSANRHAVSVFYCIIIMGILLIRF